MSTLTTTYWTSPDGERHDILPGLWNGITPFRERHAIANGWTQHEEQLLPEAPTICTKYQLVNALKRSFPALLETLRTAYATNTELQFYWNTVQELDRTNDEFRAFATALGVTDEQLEGIFRCL